MFHNIGIFDTINIRILIDLNHNDYIITLHPDGSIRESSKNKKGLGPYYRIKENDSLIKNNDTCSICLENYKKGTYKRMLSCNHIFHKKCVDKWFKNGSNGNTCPVCRNCHNTINKIDIPKN